MSRKVIIHSKAEKEYADAYKWYESTLPGLGSRFETAIEQQIKHIAINPEHFPVKVGTYREAVVKTFPFVIVFTISHKLNSVVIVSIFHTSRNPRKKIP